MALLNYNMKKVQLVVGNILVSGYAKGTGIKIGRNTPAYANGNGSQGDGWRGALNNKSGKCEITLLRGSKTNAALSELALLDELSGDGVVPLLLKDLSGASKYSAEHCWIEMVPEQEFADENTDITWVIQSNELEVFVGGN